jgi:ABC-2 type transport system ATP-binding protein
VVVVHELLTVEHLTKRYDGRGGIDGVSFGVSPGEVVGLLGPNGSGKTTTLHCIAGVLEPDSGAVMVGGRAATDPVAKDMLGFAPDDLPMPASLRLPEVLTLHRRLRPSFDAAYAYRWVEHVGLETHLDKFIGHYSHGMKRKLQLVLALAHRPRLLVLDEPVQGLDPEAAALVLAVIGAVRDAGGAVLVSTHDLRGAADYCTDVVVLADGIVVSEGTPADLLAGSGASTLLDHFIGVTGLRATLERKRSSVERAIRESFAESSSSPQALLERIV